MTTQASQPSQTTILAIDPFIAEGNGLRSAVDTAKTIAGALHSRVVAASVVSPDQLKWPTDFQETWTQKFETLGKEALEKAVNNLGERFETHVVCQPVHSTRESARALMHYAGSNKALALMVTTHVKRSTAGSLFGGFVSSVIACSTVPVLAINASAEPIKAIRKILFASDLFPNDEPALNTAIAWAKTTGAELIIANSLVTPVLADAVGMFGGWSEIDSLMTEETKRAFQVGETWSKRAKDLGVTAKFMHVTGFFSVGEAVLKTAEEQNADLIIMSKKTESATVAALLGSVAQDVLARTKLPLLLLRTNAQKGT